MAKTIKRSRKAPKKKDIAILMELAKDCVVGSPAPNASAALVWSPEVGYMFRAPSHEDGAEVSGELVALAACFVRLADDKFREDMVNWYARNQN